MYEYARNLPFFSYFYFISIIIFGHIMMFNLFLSIMMSNYELDETSISMESNKDDNRQIKQQIKKFNKTIGRYYDKIKNCLSYCLDCGEDKISPEEERDMKQRNSKRRGMVGENFLLKQESSSRHKSVNNLNMRLQQEKLKNLQPMIRKSLYLFTKESNFRRFCWKVVTDSSLFEYCVLINIIIALAILAIDNPTITSTTTKNILFYIDLVTSFFFIIESLVKIVAFGFLFNGKYSYLRSAFGILEFTSLCLSIMYIIGSSNNIYNPNEQYRASSANKAFRIVKMLRIVRVFKLINRSKSLQAALSALLASLKQMLNIFLIGSIFILVFAIIGMTYFRGLLFRCNFKNVPFEYMENIKTKWDCLDYGGEWINPYPNFDNVRSSLILFFEMMTIDGWTNYMYAAIDSTSLHNQPIINNKPAWCVYFIVYMIISYFFILNLSIAILSDNFKHEKSQIENQQFKSPIQKEFFKVFSNLYKVKIPKKRKKTDKFSKLLLNILDSIYFDVVITVCIISNLGILMINSPGIDKGTQGFVYNMNTIFNYIFIVEAAFKIIVYRLSYFFSGWNILDFIIVLETVLNIILAAFSNQISFFDSTVLRAIRVARILRLMKKAQSLNKIFNLFLNSIPGVINIAVLYFLLLFLYSVIGMSMFSFIKHQTIIGPKWNFQNFENSLMMLIRMTSGEGWNLIMHECARERNGFYYCKYYDEMTPEEIISKNKLFIIILTRW